MWGKQSGRPRYFARPSNSDTRAALTNPSPCWYLMIRTSPMDSHGLGREPHAAGAKILVLSRNIKNCKSSFWRLMEQAINLGKS